MELPLYHVPNARTIGLYVKNNTVAFMRKAGTLILISSAVLWLLSYFAGRTVEQSVLAYAGRELEPLGATMGLGDWKMIVALITSFFAKENTIATLGILYGADPGSAALSGIIAATLLPAARWAFLAVAMLFIPCLATVATIRQETGSWRWTAASIGLLLAVSMSVGVIVFQIGIRVL
jgi:ferrous iron transport protein B